MKLWTVNIVYLLLFKRAYYFWSIISIIVANFNKLWKWMCSAVLIVENKMASKSKRKRYSGGLYKGNILVTHAYEAHNLRSACHNAPNGPINCCWNMSSCSNHFRCVWSNVLRRKLLELNDALGDIQHGLDEVVKCLKFWFQGFSTLQYFRHLLEECNRFGKRVGRVKLHHQPKFTVVHSKSSQG